MPYRPPLVAHEYFVADPPELPVRERGEGGLSALTSAELVAADGAEVMLKAVTSAEETLVVQVGVAGEGVIRVRLSEDATARPRSERAVGLVSPGTYARARAEVAPGAPIVIDAGPLRAEISLNPWHLRFTDAAGATLVEQDRGHVDISGRLRTLPFGRSSSAGTPVAYHESFAAAPDEAFSGFGESFTRLDKRGQRPVMWNFDAFGAESQRAYKNVPLYLSSRGYGVLVDSGAPTEFDVCQSTHSVVQIVVPDDVLDYYVIAGPTPAEVLDRYDLLTCRPSLPPKWAFGTWISSGFCVDSQERVLARARTIRERGIPCDVLHLDTYWQADGHWSELKWDATNFPDPDGMLAELDGMGFKVCLWMNPYISHLSPTFREAAEAGYFLKNQAGQVYVADCWHGSFPACGIVDFTNPAATEWFKGLLRPLLRQGVAAFKTDFAEGVPSDAVAYNGMSGADLHNVYTLLFNDVVAGVTREVNGHELVWARSSYLGGQRHSAQWGGDTYTSYAAMGSTIRGGLAHGLSGVPFWSHDAGGFTGRPTDDLYVRWTQFGALSPLLRLHGTTTREPWEFPEVEAEAVAALKLRYRLMPYLYSAAVEAARTGAPMMRALCVDFPDDPVAWQADLQYLLGRDLLVAPMTAPEGTRSVYLPRGLWVDYWTHEVLEGARYVTVSKPLDQIPLFVRHGALIPVQEQRETVDVPAEIALVAFGGGDGTVEIHDADGVTIAVATRDGADLRVAVTGPKRVTGVEIAPVAGAPARAVIS
ncbi:Alpha-xylosidase [[Actinomadura] parvosata subsp. kistnae]|uniref:Alpha-xylosidase n=1 Tax=[Actinomadura] parvosata subsp. kistnae TaxID=1909395 RepID=A0A1V0A957_9ACTN|nr:TIM-barrel domain-containing protein [Nonomuraea sp. ATCC 55076]AQZ66731.1 alpha-xylosidase [Nonomuraea sp. ATCC 55076]SPL95150.1 Alpha-xylosidase [Actinomadura parvosata subsp. kistnae]